MTAPWIGRCSGCHAEDVEVCSRRTHGERVLCARCAAGPYTMPTAGGIGRGRATSARDALHAAGQPPDAPPDSASGPLRGGLPVIEASGRPLRDVTADALAALEAVNARPVVFVRSAALARVRRDEQHRPMIEAIGESHLRGSLTRAANFVRTSDKGAHQVAPPLDVVRDLLALGTWPFPALQAIVEAPALRCDGTIISTPGYDASNRLVYAPAPGLTVPAVAEQPTTSARVAALKLLEEAIEGFPFDDDASRANALALILTPILRPAISGQVPLALLDATKAGTGKGLLAGLAATIATGRPAAVLAAPTYEEEWAKLILAALIRGSTFVLLDEVAGGVLRSPSLAAALTAPTFEGRILGRSETVQLAQRATWVAAGNNVSLGGDLARRCYQIRLDAKTARPWQRTGFRHPDLLAWAAQRRGDLLAALLTISRSWYADGQPAASTPVLGGFGEWASTLGGVLAHAGVHGFLSNLEALYELADQEAAAWEVLLRAWQARYGAKHITVAQITTDIHGDGGLRDELPENLAIALAKSEASFKAKLGKALGKRTGTRYAADGLRVERVARSEKNAVSTWQVRADESSRGAEVAEVNPPVTRVENEELIRAMGVSTSGTSAPRHDQVDGP